MYCLPVTTSLSHIRASPSPLRHYDDKLTEDAQHGRQSAAVDGDQTGGCGQYVSFRMYSRGVASNAVVAPYATRSNRLYSAFQASCGTVSMCTVSKVR
jgi:hypothetical protein